MEPLLFVILLILTLEHVVNPIATHRKLKKSALQIRSKTGFAGWRYLHYGYDCVFVKMPQFESPQFEINSKQYSVCHAIRWMSSGWEIAAVLINDDMVIRVNELAAATWEKFTSSRYLSPSLKADLEADWGPVRLDWYHTVKCFDSLLPFIATT